MIKSTRSLEITTVVLDQNDVFKKGGPWYDHFKSAVSKKGTVRVLFPEEGDIWVEFTGMPLELARNRVKDAIDEADQKIMEGDTA